MNRRILIIDDDKDDILSLKEAFIMKGFTNLQLCLTVEDALNYLEENEALPPHLILTDLKMPITSGLDFIWTLKGRCSFKNIPVIAFSSSSELFYKEKALSTGAINFVSKPSSQSAYNHFVEKVTDNIL